MQTISQPPPADQTVPLEAASPYVMRVSLGERVPDTDVRTALKTGDLGFLHEGELFVTGRLKDLIILRGRNLYPQDLELTAEQSHPALRAGGGAAFSVDARGEESVVVVHEVERRAGELGAIADAVRRAVAEEHGVRVADVVLLRAGTIPKTSSGKIRRGECRARYLAGELEALHRSAAAPPSQTSPTSAGRLLTRHDLLDLDPAERASVLMAWLLGAMLEDASPTEQRNLLAKVPAPARMLYRMVGRDQYAREIAALRGVPAG